MFLSCFFCKEKKGQCESRDMQLDDGCYAFTVDDLQKLNVLSAHLFLGCLWIDYLFSNAEAQLCGRCVLFVIHF